MPNLQSVAAGRLGRASRDVSGLTAWQLPRALGAIEVVLGAAAHTEISELACWLVSGLCPQPGLQLQELHPLRLAQLRIQSCTVASQQGVLADCTIPQHPISWTSLSLDSQLSSGRGSSRPGTTGPAIWQGELEPYLSGWPESWRLAVLRPRLPPLVGPFLPLAGAGPALRPLSAMRPLSGCALCHAVINSCPGVSVEEFEATQLCHRAPGSWRKSPGITAQSVARIAPSWQGQLARASLGPSLARSLAHMSAMHVQCSSSDSSQLM